MPETDSFKFRAFISYSRSDLEWAVWLHRALETYRVPRALKTRTRNSGRRFGKCFRDEEELRSGELGPQIESALDSSQALIVICSPRSARSRWVAKELAHFKRRRGDAHIFALIIDGTPHAAKADEECFPEPLKWRLDSFGNPTHDSVEPLAPDVRVAGKEGALLRLVAGLIGVDFDDLAQREARRRRVERRRALILSAVGVALLALGIVGLGASLIMKDNVALARSRLIATSSLAELAAGHTDNAMLLAVLAAPPIGAKSPVSHEAQTAIDAVGPYIGQTIAVFHESNGSIQSVKFSRDGRFAFSTDDRGNMAVYSVARQEVAMRIASGGNIAGEVIYASSQSSRMLAVSRGDGSIEVWDLGEAKLIGGLGATNHPLVAMQFVEEDQLDSGVLFIASKDGELSRINFARGRFSRDVLSILPSPISRIWIANNGIYAAVELNDKGSSFWLYSASTGKLVSRLGEGDSTRSSVIFDPKRPLMFSGSYEKKISTFYLPTGRLLDVEDADGPVLSLALSPDGSDLIASMPAGSIEMWRVTYLETRKPTASLNLFVTSPAHDGWLPAVRYAPDGSWIATIGRDARVKRWNRTFEPIATMRGHGSEVRALDISPDGRSMVSGDGDGVVRFWAVLPKLDSNQHAHFSAEKICAALPKNRDSLEFPPQAAKMKVPGLYVPNELAQSNVIGPSELFPCERAVPWSIDDLAEIARESFRSLFGRTRIANRKDCETVTTDRLECVARFDRRREMSKSKDERERKALSD